MTTIELRITGERLPGLRFADQEPVHVGVQRGTEVTDLVPGDAAEAVFRVPVTVAGTDESSLDYRGPYVHGRRGERFLYLSWGRLAPDGRFEMFRRAKLHLSALDEQDVARALTEDAPIEGRLSLTDERGGPLCACVRPPRITWRVASRSDALAGA